MMLLMNDKWRGLGDNYEYYIWYVPTRNKK